MEVLEDELAHGRWAVGKLFVQYGNDIVAQFAEEARFPVVECELWETGVQHLIEGRIGKQAEAVEDRGAECLDPMQRYPRLIRWAAVTNQHCRQLLTRPIRAMR